MQIYEILAKDHDELKGLLSQLVALDDKADPTALVAKIREGLIPHSRAEEAVFYNTLRIFADSKSKVMHGFKEHVEAEMLLRSLQLEEKIKAGWKKTAQALKEGIEHHIAEEQSEVFALGRRHLTAQEAEQIGAAFQKLKQEKLEDGFMKASLDLVANVMPPRFTEHLRNFKDPARQAS